MIGDLLYEGKGKLVGIRLLNVEEYKIEHTMLEEGKFKDIEITLIGTFWTIPTSLPFPSYNKSPIIYRDNFIVSNI